VQAEVDALNPLQAETAAELGALLPAILDRTFIASRVTGSLMTSEAIQFLLRCANPNPDPKADQPAAILR